MCIRDSSIGANDRIRIGMIGCGDRGRTAHMQGIYKHLAATNFEIVALADPWRIHREQANGMVKEWFGREAKLFTSYRDLLAMDGIDAVKWSPKVGQVGSLTQSQQYDPYVQETTSAQSRSESQGRS